MTSGQRWVHWLLERNRRGTRYVLLIALSLYPTFGLLDYLLAPRNALPYLYSTRALVVVVTLILLRLVGKPVFDRHPNLIPSSYILPAAFGLSPMTVFMAGLASPY